MLRKLSGLLSKPNYILSYRRALTPLIPDINNVQIKEIAETPSYVENKKIIQLALRDSSGKFYDRNVVLYCLIHCYTLLTNANYGHDTKFWEKFNDYINSAIKMKIIIPGTFDYGGQKITIGN